jgi:hypothetical protein
LDEVDDGCAILATVRVDASAGWAEQADVAGFSASVLSSAALAWTESADLLHMDAVSEHTIPPNPRQTYTAQTRKRGYVGQARTRMV